MKIAVDAMGGDNAPHAVVAGAVQAAKEYGVGIILVGIEQVIQEELNKHHHAKSLPLEIRNATEVVDMLDSPATVYRRKKDSSIRIANEPSSVRRSCDQCGHTGAMATCLCPRQA
jgi:glycerol-3-phosphate acyltransferase PlsX